MTKFKITRAWAGGRPCDRAVLEDYVRIDQRNGSDPDLCCGRYMNATAWYASGANHRVVDGKITRDMPSTDWFIEIESLDQLLELGELYGKFEVSRVSSIVPPIWEIYFPD